MPDFYRDVRCRGADFGVWYQVHIGSKRTLTDPGQPHEICVVSIQHKAVEMTELLSEDCIQEILDDLYESICEEIDYYERDNQEYFH